MAPGPSKSAKKKAKKKAAAARKADGAENAGEADSLEAAGVNGHTDHEHTANGTEASEIAGAANKKKKSKGLLCQLWLRLSSALQQVSDCDHCCTQDMHRMLAAPL